MLRRGGGDGSAQSLLRRVCPKSHSPAANQNQIDHRNLLQELRDRPLCDPDSARVLPTANSNLRVPLRAKYAELLDLVLLP